MTYATLPAQNIPKVSAAEIEAIARRERAAFTAGLLKTAWSAVVSLVARMGAPTPADELYALDDRALADIGIARHEIPHVLKHGRDADREVRFTTRPAANTDVKPATANRAANGGAANRAA